MPKRIGRPPIENANDIKLSIRINPQIAVQLEDYCKTYGKSKGAAVREGLKMLFAAAQNEQK